MTKTLKQRMIISVNELLEHHISATARGEIADTVQYTLGGVHPSALHKVIAFIDSFHDPKEDMVSKTQAALAVSDAFARGVRSCREGKYTQQQLDAAESAGYRRGRDDTTAQSNDTYRRGVEHGRKQADEAIRSAFKQLETKAKPVRTYTEHALVATAPFAYEWQKLAYQGQRMPAIRAYQKLHHCGLFDARARVYDFMNLSLPE